MMNKFLSVTLLFTFIFANNNSNAQHTHTHADGSVHVDHGGEEEAPQATQSETHFNSEISSDKYELLLRYEPIEPNEEAHLTLFISDYNTNSPINDAVLQITAQEDAGIQITPEKEGDGTYHIHATFPEKKNYSLAVSVNSSSGADLLLMQNVEVGKELTSEAEAPHDNWYSSTWFIVVLSIIGGMLLLKLLQRLGRTSRAAIGAVLLLLFVPLRPSICIAQHAHDGAEQKKTSGNGLNVPKETQFLLDMITQKVVVGGAVATQNFFGTVIPSSNGQALITSPQTGKITSLNTSVGAIVSAGQTLAVLEGSVDAASSMAMQAEKNNLQAEYEAARKELERMKSIADIAAKKDVDEAEARFSKAQNNLELFKNRSATRTELKAPISGVVDNFTLSIGASIAQGETLFTIVNPSTVYVDAQVFGNASVMVNEAQKFVISTSAGNELEAKLLAIPQTLHQSNQSQHVLFEVSNADKILKIGEYVTVRLLIPTDASAIVIPSAAITEIDGKSAIFIKISAEQFALKFVNTENDNGSMVTITKGLESGQRVVVNATYQMKMIYLNQ